MRIGVLPLLQVNLEVLLDLGEKLPRIFPDTACLVIDKPLPVSDEAYAKLRNQYNSSVILDQINAFAAANLEFDRVLGVANLDIFASGLNYNFGEAYTPGKAALISLWRLNPIFYGEPSNDEVYKLRTLKEAVHELGHTLGLQHCIRSNCVMHFSNSIFDTDKKQSLFCKQDYLQASLAINMLGSKV